MLHDLVIHMGGAQGIVVHAGPPNVAAGYTGQGIVDGGDPSLVLTIATANETVPSASSALEPLGAAKAVSRL